MKLINFITLSEAFELHDRSVHEFGGSPSVRDSSLLESALATPQASFGGQFLHEGLPAMGAAYLFHVMQNHPLIDGNKRTAALVARVFLMLNDIEFDPSERGYGDLVLAVASGQLDKTACAEFFRKHAHATR